MKIAIISGGEIQKDFAELFLKENHMDIILAADRGLEFCHSCGILPDFILGDYDSIDKKVYDYYCKMGTIPMEIFPSEKDDTDTEIAFRRALQKQPEEVCVFGAMGGRMDHFIANVNLLELADVQGIPAYLLDRQNRIRVISETTRIRKVDQFGAYVSFLPFTDCVTGVTLTGFKYPLHEYHMVKASSIGVSNEIIEETAEVSFKSGKLLMIESRDK